MKQLLESGYSGAKSAIHRPMALVFKKVENPEGRIFTKPNMVSVTRIPLGFAVAIMIRQHVSISAILMVFLAAVISDLVDGEGARIEGTTRLGALIDPWCDKIFLAPPAWELHRQMWPAVFWALCAIELLLFVVPFFALGKPKVDPGSVIWGKTKFCVECAAIVLLLFRRPLYGNLVLACALPLAAMSIKDKGPRIISQLRAQ